MEYLIEAIGAKLRANANLAAEVGVDARGAARIYHEVSPQRTFPHVTFSISGGDQLACYGGPVIDQWSISFSIYAETSRKACEIEQYLYAAFHKCSLDGLAVTETSQAPEPGSRTTYEVVRTGEPFIYQDESEIWTVEVNYRVGLFAA
jgi:hypothetical protein